MASDEPTSAPHKLPTIQVLTPPITTSARSPRAGAYICLHGWHSWFRRAARFLGIGTGRRLHWRRFWRANHDRFRIIAFAKRTVLCGWLPRCKHKMMNWPLVGCSRYRLLALMGSTSKVQSALQAVAPRTVIGLSLVPVRPVVPSHHFALTTSVS
jgi:hypothetical protein